MEAYFDYLERRKAIENNAARMRKEEFAKCKENLSAIDAERTEALASVEKKIDHLNFMLSIPLFGYFFQDSYNRAIDERHSLHILYYHMEEAEKTRHAKVMLKVDNDEAVALSTLIHKDETGVWNCRHQGEFYYCPKMYETISRCKMCKYYTEL